MFSLKIIKLDCHSLISIYINAYILIKVLQSNGSIVFSQSFCFCQLVVHVALLPTRLQSQRSTSKRLTTNAARSTPRSHHLLSVGCNKTWPDINCKSCHAQITKQSFLKQMHVQWIRDVELVSASVRRQWCAVILLIRPGIFFLFWSH